MRYESPSFRIDVTVWSKGNNSYDHYPEGGLLASTVGANMFSKPGLLSNNPALGSTVTASLPTKGVISWGVGSGSSAPSVMAVYANASNNGSFWTTNVSTGAMTQVGAVDTTRSYKLGVTDTVFYLTQFYTTSETDICIQAADLTSRTESWWIGTKGQSALTSGIPHPQIVFEGIHYIADGRYLHKNDNGTVTTQVFDVDADHIITALVEWSGLIYIVAEPYKNLDGTVHGLAQMYSWDGLSESWYEKYFLDYRVNALYVYKNKLYCWNNKFFGIWDGSEIKPIRPVSNQVFKSQITATSDSMFFADGTLVVRYGAPFIGGISRRMHNYINSAALNFSGIISISGDNLILSEQHASASPVYLISNANTPQTSGARTFQFNKRRFKSPVKPTGVVIETEPLASGQIVKAGFVNDEGTTVYPTFSSGEFNNATTGMAGKSNWRFDFHNVKSTKSMIPQVVLTAGAHIRAIDYIYEGSEAKQNV